MTGGRLRIEQSLPIVVGVCTSTLVGGTWLLSLICASLVNSGVFNRRGGAVVFGWGVLASLLSGTTNTSAWFSQAALAAPFGLGAGAGAFAGSVLAGIGNEGST
jgi:hypothetical protein